MFISITFPVADFRNLHRYNAGRLNRPAWGHSDPQAKFARGFGAIHTRTKSGNGFIGENYYADCDNLVRYPRQCFLTPIPNLNRAILAYPFYRRFYFDGQMAGRFEFGFRLNEGSIDAIEATEGPLRYSASSVARQMLESDVRIELADGRKLVGPFSKSMDALRDGWLLSSTKTDALRTFDIESVGSNYVGVGRPFAFIRAGVETNLDNERQKRMLIQQDDLELFITRSRLHGQHFDTAVTPSKRQLDHETAKERLARLFYTQIRTLAFAHSFYLRQVSSGKIEGPKSLEPAVQSLLDRLRDLAPLEDRIDDELTCFEMRKILEHADIDIGRLTREIETQVKPGRLRRYLGVLFSYFDRKTDIAIEAAASAATKQLLSGSL